MQLTYAVSFEDFRRLQPPFTTRAGSNAGFKGVLVACALIGLLGLFCIAKGMGFAVGAFLIGLGIVAATVAYGYDLRTVRKAKQKHDENLATAYRQIHCPEQREFGANDSGFTASCQCGTLTRPWAELTGFSESEFHLFVATRAGWQVLPKSSFRSEGEITEFRALVTSKLNNDRPVTSRHLEFQHKREDYRHAYILHTLKGGGWRALLKGLARFACVGAGVLVIGNAIRPGNRAILYAPIVGVLGIQLLQFVSRGRKHYLGPLRVYFSDAGLHLQDPKNQSRCSWNQFIGYLEDLQLILLYSTPRRYRIIPKRALGAEGPDFLALLKAKLRPYDYQHLDANRTPEFPMSQVKSDTRTTA